MPASFTPVLNLQTPEVGSEVDTWSAVVQANWEILDDQFEDVGGTIYPVGLGPSSIPTFGGIMHTSPNGDYQVSFSIDAADAFAGSVCELSFIDNTDPFSPLGYPAISVIRTSNGSFNMSLLSGRPDFEDSEGVIFIPNVLQVPLGNPLGGGFFYVQAGALKYRGSSGTITTIAPA